MWHIVQVRGDRADKCQNTTGFCCLDSAGPSLVNCPSISLKCIEFGFIERPIEKHDFAFGLRSQIIKFFE